MWAGKWIFFIRKIGVKYAYLRFLVYKYILFDSPVITFIYNFGNYLSRILTQDAAKGMDILFTMKLKMLKRNEFFIILLDIFKREMDYYSRNLSILNISSYSD